MKTSADKSEKLAGVASDGEFWIAKVLDTIDQLNKDAKHVEPLAEFDEDEKALHEKARELVSRLKKVYCHVCVGYQWLIAMIRSLETSMRRREVPSFCCSRPCCSNTRRTNQRALTPSLWRYVYFLPTYVQRLTYGA